MQRSSSSCQRTLLTPSGDPNTANMQLWRLPIPYLVPIIALVAMNRPTEAWVSPLTPMRTPMGRAPLLPCLQATFSKVDSKISIKSVEDKLDDDKHSSTTTATNTTTEPTVLDAASKIRRLKDSVWMRETLEDLTSAEFACTVEATQQSKRRAVDYEKVWNQLNLRLADLGYRNETVELEPTVGMGTALYTETERKNLLQRLLHRRYLLVQVMKDNDMDVGSSSEKFSLQLPELPELRVPKVDTAAALMTGPKLYVRDDGTVDWDGALQDQEALRNFGTAVWARINGRDPASEEDDEGSNSTSSASAAVVEKPKVTAKIEETDAILSARDRLQQLKQQLTTEQRRHTALLNSAIQAGQAVANVKLAALEPSLRNQIQVSDTSLISLEEKVSFQTLVYELERIYTYLMGELGNSKGYVPLQDRLNVAEFGLLAMQIEALQPQLDDDAIVDVDVLTVVMEQMTDFKRRLGIDYYVTGLSFDKEAIRRWLGELLEKTKSSLSFYGKGCRLFANDIMYCTKLINRAAQGYTLKPREVRTLR